VADLLPMVRAFIERERRAASAVAGQVEARRALLGEAAEILRDDFGASEVLLFGSMVDGGVHAGWDADLSVRGLSPQRYFDALARLSELFGCDVDLVELESARESLRAHIDATCVVLHRG